MQFFFFILFLLLGFHTFFASLGFKCLRFRQFMQYVGRNIIEITPQFAAKLITGESYAIT